MSLTADIYDAFAVQVEGFATAQGLRVAYPGISFDPLNDKTWLEVQTFWNDGINYGMANSGPTVEQGFFRILVCRRPGAGLMDPQAVAESIVRAFPKGSQFGPARTERAPSLSGPVQSDDKMVIPVTIRWRATRTT